MDVDLLRPGTVPIAPDTILWFEFLLNPQLLVEHLRKSNPDPTPVELITKFFDVISESMKIQNESDNGETNNMNTVDISSEKPKYSNKNIALKLLSLKIVAYIKWDLGQIRLLPFKTQMALIQDLLYFTNDRKLVEIPLVDNQWNNSEHLFALLMYHRWMLNVTMNRITTNWQLKVGSVDISPSEESVICTLENVNNTVKFLENSLEWDNIPRMPKLECFELPTEINENIKFDWSKSEIISREELVSQICYELGTYFFYREEYKSATERFQRCLESLKAIKSSNGFLNFDEEILEVYLKACCGPFDPFSSSIVNNYMGITGILQKDNIKREIPLTYRINLELDIQGAMSSGSFYVVKDLLPQIKALNLVRCILDRKPIHQYHITLSRNPDVFIWAIQLTWRNFPAHDKKEIKRFLMDYIINTEASAILSQVQSNPILCEIFDVSDVKYMKSFEEELDIPSILLEETNGLEEYKKKIDIYGKREMKLLEQQLITTYDPQVVREILTMTSLNNIRISVWNINPLWELPIPLQSVLQSLSRGFLQDFAYLMLAKSKEQMLASNWDLSLKLIRTLEKELQINSGSNIAKLGQMIKWEILLIQIVQLLHEWPKSTIDKNALAAACENCLQSNETVLPRTEIAEYCVICLLNLGKWDFLMNFDKRRSSSEIASALAFTCQEWVKFKMKEDQDLRRGIDLKKMPPPQLPKILWEIVLPTFTSFPKRGNQGSAYQDSQLTNLRANVSSFFANVRDPTAFSVIISMLTRFYNVLRDMSKADQQIIVEGVDWWPLSVNNPQPYNVKAVAELLPQITLKALKFYPNNVKWLRLMGDVNLVKDHYQIALKYYLQSLLIQTDYFNIPVPHDDDLYLRLIQCSTSLNCFTQAAVLYQFLEKPNYKQAFYYLRESKMGNDAVDAYYHCLWDINILEYLIHLHNQRGEFQRKKCAIQVMGLLEINSSNNEEIQREASNSRKATFLRAMCKQYVFN
ncbi:integrator complex subunit 8 [Coccinella septempunctata]|uniref:integrator complex subunit 8 n=1 Tax=Coccinella septempunctata TaxID=41139 RepID=UPI001D0923C9|nr:integrator complex subunit 8 [Coccinella septempunctata]